MTGVVSLLSSQQAVTPEVPGVGLITCAEGEGYRSRIMLGTPTLGLIRIEWHEAMASLIIPCAWSWQLCTPKGFLVDDAQNLICKSALDGGVEWVFFVEDDTAPPPDALLRLNEHLRAAANRETGQPIVSGLYRLKGGSGEPLMYRGIAQGAYWDWKPGDQVWVRGVPTGCLLVHMSLIKILWDESPEYTVKTVGGEVTLRRVFENPRRFEYHPESHTYATVSGTSDLAFCERVIKDDVLRRAGWLGAADRAPNCFLVDTRIACGHLDRETGIAY